ncbi:glycoside hydrolase family 17 protein [Algoriphagus hitonicola]|uniref:Endo-1,3-beta-glucanase btgC n=1 Tax=Algoriphagus hitonicola TaxID=435880 RepID=A0A1I2RF18_9BACT|nr:glycosyl hydrolase family 17 protein [Algoriphagus hitonicola]SFG38643.1 Exo-beta-1,3-glucanase, GH17 family [Algoriphagus hitonicola]
MSFNADKVLALAGKDLQGLSIQELAKSFNGLLQEGIHGICFSPYVEGQQPGDTLTEEQVRRRLEIIRPHTDWVRSFSCTEGNELIPIIAKELGMKTLVGAWLGKDDQINQDEIQGLIKLANEGYVDIAAVGNEVMYRKDLSEEALLDFIHRVKKELPKTVVGYVDAYYEFERKPRITEACDVILANCYPYWEGCALDYSLLYIKDMYNRAVKAGNGKKVIITETGWPSQGSPLYGAVPSDQNFLKYFINIQTWSKMDSVDIFYFSSFDESWKVGAEGDVGAYWGIWDKDEQLKY